MHVDTCMASNCISVFSIVIAWIWSVLLINHFQPFDFIRFYFNWETIYAIDILHYFILFPMEILLRFQMAVIRLLFMFQYTMHDCDTIIIIVIVIL